MMTEDPLQLWGGVECTCNRVQDTFYDQMSCSGHLQRLEDIEAFASLGLKTLRFGLLWEKHDGDASWAWGDARLSMMRRLGIRPIVGLLHHGSGPRHTSLVDPDFPAKLAGYAQQVAERYPWVDAYTPVNEPNTTARFSCHYGLWYPHHRSRQSYLHALLNQLKGTVLSMRAIRRIQPKAQLIQTEDIGRIWSTPELAPERELLNHRRWITYDLLCGEVDRDHPLYRYMRSAGVSERKIMWFLDNPCPPEVLGINYYVTSDRFLDHRVEHYPADRGSIEGPYVDVDAVRVRPEGIAGFESLMMEAWQRYHLPLAITEVHLGDCPAQQIRWLAEAWEAAHRVRGVGVPCLAVTVWALMGSFHWDVLVTRPNGHYEPGVFDVSSGGPVQTALARAVIRIACGETLTDLTHADPAPGDLAPVDLAQSSEGWWRRDDRIAYRPPDPSQPVLPVSESVAEDVPEGVI